MKKLRFLFVVLLCISLSAGCSSSPSPTPSPKPVNNQQKTSPSVAPTPTSAETTVDPATLSQNPNNPTVVFEFQDFGKVEAVLLPEYAPNTVNSFIALVNQGFYNGISIHRIEPNFVIQGGDPEGTGMGGPGYSIKGEFTANGFKANTLKHTRGVLSMARRADSFDSAGSQFFVCLTATPSLNNQYAGFGIVTAGMEIVDAMVEAYKKDPSVRPVMEKVSVDTKGKDYPEPEKLP